MRKILNLAAKLFLICLVAGLALGLTNELTADAIAQQALLAANEARKTALPEADTFEMVSEGQGGTISAYAGTKDGELKGYVALVAVKGYAGEIEITIGMDCQGVITGINVGGSNFKETAGLGAKTKDTAFTRQFAGLTAPLTVKGNVVPVTGATISSTAVTNGVNTACEYLSTLLG